MHAHEQSFLILLLLGAAHGLNPAMGWLFAVSLGLQEQRRGSVWRAFGPLALGHGLAIAVALGGAALLGLVIPIDLLKWVVAAALLTMGILQLTRHRHPRWGGMRVDAKDLTIWSFLMATAHGAGLMAVPFVIQGRESSAVHTAGGAGGVRHLAAEGSPPMAAGLNAVESSALVGTALHTIGYLIVAALIAVIVYEKVGLRLLRHAWINLNLIWAGALIATAILTPLF
jgi:hypothetical protein